MVPHHYMPDSSHLPLKETYHYHLVWRVGFRGYILMVPHCYIMKMMILELGQPPYNFALFV